jgi:uncharacterized membrane protein
MRSRVSVILIYLILWAVGNIWIGRYWAIIQRGELKVLVCVGEVIDINSTQSVDQILKMLILTGPLRGEVVDVENKFLGRPFADRVIHVGDKLFLQMPILSFDESGGIRYKKIYLGDYFRSGFILNMVGVFGFLLVLLGMKGIRAIFSLAISGAAMLFLLLPALIRGWPPVPISLAISVVITLLTFLIVGGLNRKSVAGTIGTLGGLLSCVALAYISSKALHFTGVDVEFGFMKLGTILWRDQAMKGEMWDFRGILLAGMMIGALGAMMDVCMAISSAVDEVKKANPQTGVLQAIRSGLNVGRDVMGTVTNTLIFAYLGSDLTLFILPSITFPQAGRVYPFLRVINRESTAVEAIQGLAGTIGLVLAIPITAAIAGVLIGSRKPDR